MSKLAMLYMVLAMPNGEAHIIADAFHDMASCQIQRGEMMLLPNILDAECREGELADWQSFRDDWVRKYRNSGKAGINN